MNKEIEIPFGAKDSELKGWEYTIPEGMEAEIKDGKIIVKQKESEDERIRKAIEGTISVYGKTQGEWLCGYDMDTLVIHLREAFGALERQKEQKPAEWNDADMRETRQNLISCCRDWERGEKTTLLPVVAVHARYFLEHLTEPQKPASGNSEKPNNHAEWGEEDITNGWRGVDSERYLSCLQRLGTGNPQQPETINSKWFKEHCHPQPHWKPSEEQMEALKDAFRKDGGNEYRKVINSLYCDLQKLL